MEERKNNEKKEMEIYQFNNYKINMLPPSFYFAHMFVYAFQKFVIICVNLNVDFTILLYNTNMKRQVNFFCKGIEIIIFLHNYFFEL